MIYNDWWAAELYPTEWVWQMSLTNDVCDSKY